MDSMSINHFKLDIEKRLWGYFVFEPLVQTVMYFESSAGDDTTIELVKKIRREINDAGNPVLKAVLEIISSQNLNTKPLVYEGVNEESNSPIACQALDSGFYLYYNPLLLKVFEEKEVRAFVAHEIGHFIFPVQINPVKCITPFLKSPKPSSHELQGFCILALMLAHLNEYNADRYSLFITKDFDIYKSAFPKMSTLVRHLSPDQPTEEEIEKNIAQDWRNKYMYTHPSLNSRISALQLVAEKLWDPDFNINKDQELNQQLKELVSYDRFMEHFGDYYEELKKKSENSEDAFKY